MCIVEHDQNIIYIYIQYYYYYERCYFYSNGIYHVIKYFIENLVTDVPYYLLLYKIFVCYENICSEQLFS